MSAEHWQRLRTMGDEFAPAVIEATRALCAPLALRPQDAGATCVRDLSYGEDARQRLDVFHVPGTHERPVVVFVHGGGYTGGDKGAPDNPFYNNVGAWAVRSGFVGVTMTYRRAPAWQWPCGAQDVAAAMRWLQANASAYGGDPSRIVLIGNSAGATHVAGYLGCHGQSSPTAPAASGAVLISGIFEADAFEIIPMHVAYFGADRGSYSRSSAVLTLAATRVPCLFTISEFDPPMFQRQLAAVFAARAAATGCCPEVLYLHGHNHFSPSMLLGSAHDMLGNALTNYVQRLCD